jgi:HK97 family phage prohead protease
METAAPLELFRRRLAGVNRIAWHAGDIRRIAAHFGLAERDMGAAISSLPARSEVHPTTRATGDEAPEYTFTISTPDVDRMNDSIAVKGWKLAEYRRDPVVFFNHAGDALPVGRSQSVWIEGERLRATVKLAPAAANPLAEQVRHLLNGKFLQAASVGFIPLRWEFSKDSARPYGINFLEQTLIEWSICGVPANPFCLMDANTSFSKSAAARRRSREVELIRLRSGA